MPLKDHFSSQRSNHGRIDLVIIVVVAVIVALATIAVCLHLFKQSDDHVSTVRKTNVSFSAPMQFRNDAPEGDELVKRDLELKPRRTSAKYTRIEFSEQALRYISKMYALQELSLKDTSVVDDWLVHLEGLPLYHISIHGSKVTDKGMDHLAKIKTLHSLNLSETDITDKAIKKLKPLKRLEVINLTRTRVTDQGVESLRQFRRLRHVDLDDTKVTPACLKTLTELPKLESVRFSDTPIKAGDLEILNGSRLHRLAFNRCQLSDNELKTIADFEQHLTKLDLSKNSFTDKGIEHLKKQKHLKSLVLKSCPNVSAKAVTELRAELPNTKIDYSAEVGRDLKLPPQIQEKDFQD